MRFEKLTHSQVNARRKAQGKPPLKICPICGEGAMLLHTNLEAGQDGEIYERTYICSWCGAEKHQSYNPYLQDGECKGTYKP